MFKRERSRARLNISAPSPFVSELYVNSNILAQRAQRAQTWDRVHVPDMGVLFPLLPFGTPPPLGIEFPPPKMRDLLFHKGANRAFMKTPLEKSLSLALAYSSGEQYSLNVARGARRATRRARRPCLLNYPSSLRGRISRRSVQAAAAPPVNAWVSGA